MIKKKFMVQLYDSSATVSLFFSLIHLKFWPQKP
jgi:hypothetical protein